MGKRDKKGAKGRENPSERPSGQVAPAMHEPHPPKKQPLWLAISVVLFALWLIFLFVTAVFG